MGLLQELGSVLGGNTGGAASPDVERLANGQGNFSDPSSPDHQTFQQMLGSANPQQLQQAFGGAAQQVSPDEYSNHITPGVGGTNPLGALGGPALGMIASTLMGHFMNRGISGGQLMQMVPGLRTTDPNQMDANQVASMAQYAQQNHPQVFSQAASQIGQQQPGFLSALMGNKMLLGAAAGLAGMAMGRKAGIF